MNTYDKAFLEFLQPMVNENRLELIETVLAKRTRYITVLLEDIYQAQNASAVLRTCDCLGIQDVHIVENRNSYELNPDVELGAAQWLSLHRYDKKDNNTAAAIQILKDQGYRIVATTPHKKDVDLENFDITSGKTAILFGTERIGLSKSAINSADEFIKIPMFGFTESFNISVSAAIILHHLLSNLRKSNIDWELQASEIEEIRLKWIKNSVNKSAKIERGFKKRHHF